MPVRRRSMRSAKRSYRKINRSNRKVRRIVIPPRYISTYVEEFDRNGDRFRNGRGPSNPSKNQGRCE